MTPWTKVVTDPLGLTGFALFLVFGYLAKVKRNDERRWLSPVAFAIATVALIGGLVVAYVKVPNLSLQPSKPANLQCRPSSRQTSRSNKPAPVREARMCR